MQNELLCTIWCEIVSRLNTNYIVYNIKYIALELCNNISCVILSYVYDGIWKGYYIYDGMIWTVYYTMSISNNSYVWELVLCMSLFVHKIIGTDIYILYRNWYIHVVVLTRLLYDGMIWTVYYTMSISNNSYVWELLCMSLFVHIIIGTDIYIMYRNWYSNWYIHV